MAWNGKNKESVLSYTLHDKIQSNAFSLVKTLFCKYPKLRMWHSVPNGGARPGKLVVKHGRVIRISAEGNKMRATGQMPGVLDTHYPPARCGYVGLYIEFKTPNDSLSTDQRRWAIDLVEEGHFVCVRRSAQAAVDTLIAYETGDVANLGPPGWRVPKELRDRFDKDKL